MFVEASASFLSVSPISQLKPFFFQTPRTFNAANTEDLKFVLSHINKSYPGSPIFGMGISMGG